QLLFVLYVVMAARLDVSQEEDTELAEQDGREHCATWMKGIPGTPDFDGIPGRDGRDGRAGQKGDIRGPVVFVKAPKDRMESQVNQGTWDLQEKRGFPGNPNLKGERGEGSFPYHSAFMGPIRFTKTFYNEQHHYDDISGKFRCAIPGIYYFTYHLTINGKDIKVAMYKNGRTVAFTLDQFHNGNLDQASGGLQLYDDIFDAGIYADTNNDSTFTGFLLTPKIISNPIDNRRR
uniref:Adiponectin, C1Q and collagen domain containing, a n=1 Tax=Sinocyclocheilus anshuiensis TaxID=1608454 RepID=A0A671QQW6_9TELE